MSKKCFLAIEDYLNKELLGTILTARRNCGWFQHLCCL